MPTQLYPSSAIADSLERHLARHSHGHQFIYLTTMLAVLVALALLPVLDVSISVQGTGIVRPMTDKHEVRARAPGVLADIRVRENQSVREGDVLAVVRSDVLDEKMSLVTSRAEDARLAVSDLEQLTRWNAQRPLPSTALRTAQYAQEHARFLTAVAEAIARQAKAEREAERTRLLYEKQFATASDLEQAGFDLSQAKAELSLLVERQRSEWQTGLAARADELAQLRSQLEQLRGDRALYTIYAPVAGTVEQLAGVSPGSFVQTGERVAAISPSSGLVAEVYVSPRDIGLLGRGTKARLHVDAFNSNDWGTIAATVTEIADDFILVGERPMFKVKCLLDRPYLTLPNGVRGRLRKGMTFRARFIVTERSLLRLLHDDVADWLDPASGNMPGRPQ